MTKILFIHNTAMSYRKPFFKMVSKIYDLNLIFTHLEVSKNTYGVEIDDEISGLEYVNYKGLKNYFRVAFGIIPLMFSKNYDVVVDSFLYIESLFSFTIAKLKKKPIILWSEDWGWNRKKTFKNKLISPIQKYIIFHTDAFLVPGTKHKEHFVSLGVTPEKIFIVPNISNISINDADHINKDILIKDLNLAQKKVILYVGRLVERKGVHYLIKAFAQLKKERNDLVLIIAGRGECKDKLVKLATELHVNDDIYFSGYVDDELLPAYYLLCNVCVVPSITTDMADPCPLLINEAMSIGKPVISTNAAGSSFDMIKNEKNGYVVPEKNSYALYEAINTIISNSNLEENMGNESKRIIEEKYMYKNMIDGFKIAVDYVLKN